MKVEGYVIHRSMLLIPAAPLNLSLFTAGWCKLDSFLLPWLAAIFHEQCFHRHNQTRTQARWLLALAFPLQWWNTSSACRLWWVVLNRTTCSTHTALSTTNKRKRRQMTLLPLIAGTSTTAYPNPNTENMAEGFVFIFLSFKIKAPAWKMWKIVNQKKVVRTVWIKM